MKAALTRFAATFPWLCATLIALPALGALDGVDVWLDPTRSTLIVEPRGAERIDEVCVGLPKRVTVTGVREVATSDAEWLLDVGTPGRVCTGRLHIATSRPLVLELAEPLRKGKFDVTIQGAGTMVLARKNVRARLLEPIPEVLHPSEVLSFPPQLRLHELAMGTIRRPQAIPEGGAWSFSGGIHGVVLDPPDPAPAEGGATSTLLTDAALGTYDIGERAAVVKGRTPRGKEPPQDKRPASLAEAESGVSGSIRGFVLEPEDRDALTELAVRAQVAEELIVVAIDSTFGVGQLRGFVMSPEEREREAEPAMSLEEFRASSGQKGDSPRTLGGGDPLKGLNVSRPRPDAKPPCKPVENKGQRGQTFECPGFSTVAAPDPAGGTETGGDRFPVDAVVTPIRISYIDKYGRIVVDGEQDVVSRPPWIPEGEAGAGQEPAIESGTAMAFAGRPACVCGSFPLPRHWEGVRLDDQPIALRSASTGVVTFDLPADASPGEHIVGGLPSAGFGEEDRWRVTALQLQGSVDSEQLQSGGSTTLTLDVLGTTEQLDVRLRNVTPGVIRLEGGESQTAQSSGGEPNRIERTIHALGPGAFNVEWSLDTESCPCAPAPDLLERHLNVCKVVEGGRFGQQLQECQQIRCEGTAQGIEFHNDATCTELGSCGSSCSCDELVLAADQVCWRAPSFYQAMR